MLPKPGVKDLDIIKAKNATRLRTDMFADVCNIANCLFAIIYNKESSVNRFIELVQVLIKPTGITMYIHIHILSAGEQASSRDKYMDGVRNISNAVS